MKLGIVASSNDMLTLFTFLTKYDHEYIVYYDQAHQFYGDQTFETSLLNVQSGIDYLIAEGVDYIILPPAYELALLASLADMSPESGVLRHKILPLFQEYVMKECFAYSLVGKIGAMGDYADVEVIQKYLRQLEKTYTLSDIQKAIRKFQHPFAYWTKEVQLRKYFLTKLSFSSLLVNKVVKEDLRYFKDAMVDTLIPLNYGYFNYQNTISKFLNFKKIRFHKLEKLEAVFASLISLASPDKLIPNKPINYGVKIIYTGHIEFLKRDKKRMRLLQKGTGIEIEMVKVENGGLSENKATKSAKVKK